MEEQFKEEYGPNVDRNPIKEAKLAFRDFYFSTDKKINYFFHNFSDVMYRFFEKIKKSPSWRFTGVLTIVALCCFGYVLLTQQFVCSPSGDYSMQGISFIYNGYDDWHYFFKTGVFPLWDSSSLVGVDNIYGASFYYLFDPFFLFLLIWPRSWLTNMQSILMMVKLILAGLFFYKYLHMFPKMSDTTRKEGALAYAFCGWGWFYLWFFHMQEVVTFLPLMLLGVEKIIQKKDPRMMTIGMLLMGATNYQYLAIMSVFCFLYAMFRLFQTLKTRSSKDNWAVLGIGFVSFLCGILLCCYIIFPSYYGLQDMPRLASTSSYAFSTKMKTYWEAKDFNSLFKLFFVWSDDYKYRGLYPLMSLIFMNNNSFSEPLVKLLNGRYDNAGSSLYISTPLLLLIVPSIIDACKKKQVGQILAFIFFVILLETPFTYYASGGFGETPYGRWILFPTAMLVVFVCSHIDNLKKMPKWYIDSSFVIVALLFSFVVYQAMTWSALYNDPQELNTNFDLFGFTVNLYTFVIVFQAIWIVVCYLFIRTSYTKKYFDKRLLFLIGADMVILGNISIQGQGYTNTNYLFGNRSAYQEQTKIVQTLNKHDDSNFKILNTQTNTYSGINLGMAEGYNSMSVFSSTINYQASDLYTWSALNDSSSGYTETYFQKRVNFDEFVGNKYYLIPALDTNVPFGYVDITTLSTCPSDLKKLLNSDENPNGNYKLYENTNYIDTFFAFDSYITSASMTNPGTDYEADNETNYLSHAIIDKEYYASNEDKFAGLDHESRTNMTKVSSSSYTTTYHPVYWEYPSGVNSGQGFIRRKSTSTGGDSGTIRTFSNKESDALYSVEHKSDIEASIAKGEDKYCLDSNFEVNITGYEGYPLYHLNLKYYLDADSYSGEDNIAIPGSGSSKGNSYSGLNWDSQFIMTSSNTTTHTPICASEASEDNPAFISLSYYCESGHQTAPTISFYGYDKTTDTYHKIATDNFPSSGSLSGTRKTDKGFYVSEPVYKIVGTIYGTDISMRVQSIKTEYYSEYMTNVNKLKESTPTITYRDANTVKFDTSYASKKIVVTNIGYSKGWSLTKTTNGHKEDVELFKVDGGTLGFIDDGGESSYVLSYYSKGLSTGLKFTMVGLGIQGLMFYLWYGVYFSRKDLDSMKKAFSLKGL